MSFSWSKFGFLFHLYHNKIRRKELQEGCAWIVREEEEKSVKFSTVLVKNLIGTINIWCLKQEVALVQKAVVQVESVSRTRVKKMRKERVTAVFISKKKCTNSFKVNAQEMILITAVISTNWTNFNTLFRYALQSHTYKQKA